MVQWFNADAIRTLSKVLISREWKVLLPKLWVPSIDHIDYKLLAQHYKAVIFDKDNCLTTPYTLNLVHREAVDRCKEVFGDGNVAVLSNCIGCEHAKDSIMCEFEQKYNLKVIRHYNVKKPNCKSHVLSHFGNKIVSDQIVMVGDRLSTDVLFANMHGMYSVLVDPFTEKGDNWAAIVVRRLERVFLKSFRTRH